MLVSEARQNLQDAIDAYCPRSGCGTRQQEEALAALIDNRPCILSTGGYHNGPALEAMTIANTTSDAFLAHCEAWGAQRDPQAPATAVLFLLLDHLVGVNDAGRALLAWADAHFSALYAKRLFSAAAE